MLVASLDLETVNSDPAQSVSLQNFLHYSSHRILEQALPHHFDGFLPAQRRLLFSMQDLSAWHDSKLQKSNRIVAHSSSNYHPVGNTYQVLVNMSQDWRVQALLTEPEGNWGEIENGAAAAERYTETRLSKFGEEVLFADMPSIRQNSEATPHGIVPQSITYTDMHLEEDYFPVRVPILLINGSNGIAIGIAQTWQPLAIRPLLKEMRRYLASKKIVYENLRLGYPTQPKMTSPQDAFIDALKTGRGSVQTTAPYTLETNRKGDVTRVIFTSSPPGTTTNSIGDRLTEVRDKARESGGFYPFSSFENETEGKDLRLVFNLRNATPQNALGPDLARLIKDVGLTDSQTINMVALKDRYPIQYTLETFVSDWLVERSEIIRRGAEKRMLEYEARARRLMILLWIKANYDDAVQFIKVCDTQDELYAKLSAMPGLVPGLLADELQIVLDINLRSLSKMQAEEIEKQRATVLAQLRQQQSLATDPDERAAAIDADLAWFEKSLDKLGIPTYECEFDPQLSVLLDSSRQATVKLGKGKAAPLLTSDEAWYANALKPVADKDIIVYTEKQALLRLRNSTVKSAEYIPNLLDPTDRIRGVFFANAPFIVCIADDSTFFVVQKADLPYNQVIYPSAVARLAKIKKDFARLTPVIPVDNKGTQLLVMGEDGTAKRIPLKDIPSQRSGLVMPSKLLHAAIIDPAQPFKVSSEVAGVMSWTVKNIREGSLKRTGALTKITTAVPLTAENGNYLMISGERKAISKQSVTAPATI